MQPSNEEYSRLLNKCIGRIIYSPAHKKLIIAGPGAGKTASFIKILKAKKHPKERCLVFTFLGALKEDLKKDLKNFADVFTFHGYCYFLLRKHKILWGGLQDNFEYFPPLEDFIKKDWEIIHKKRAPDFVKEFRLAQKSKNTSFYLHRANYYNAIGFDDSVYRTYFALKKNSKLNFFYNIILVDEFQDFNKLEADFVNLISNQAPIIITGDDDQSIYEEFRLADPSYIQKLYYGPDYENHELPFCMRCTEVIVGATKEIIQKAIGEKIFIKRIPKNFEYYPPIKEEDSKLYPFIELIQTSTQSSRANYFGRYIEEQILKIPKADILESHKKSFPTVLIIASNPIRSGIKKHLKERNIGSILEKEESKKMTLEELKEKSFSLLKNNPKNNLGWRIILAVYKPHFCASAIQRSQKEKPLYKILPKKFCDKILTEANDFNFLEKDKIPSGITEKEKPSIKITTFEGAKGLTAQHVFIASLQNNQLPRNPERIKPIEVRKFLVALTRARKHCHILFSTNLFGRREDPSVFLSWITENKKRQLLVNREYFLRK